MWSALLSTRVFEVAPSASLTHRARSKWKQNQAFFAFLLNIRFFGEFATQHDYDDEQRRGETRKTDEMKNENQRSQPLHDYNRTRPMPVKFNSQCLVKFAASSEFTHGHVVTNICRRPSVRRSVASVPLYLPDSVCCSAATWSSSSLCTRKHTLTHTHARYKLFAFLLLCFFFFIRIHLGVYFGPENDLKRAIFFFILFAFTVLLSFLAYLGLEPSVCVKSIWNSCVKKQSDKIEAGKNRWPLVRRTAHCYTDLFTYSFSDVLGSRPLPQIIEL